MRNIWRRTATAAGVALAVGLAGATPALVTTQLRSPGTAPVGVAAAIPGLSDRLDKILADPRLVGSQTTVDVRDAETGEVVYTRNGDTRSIPASNEKLLTSAAAADLLGLDHRFTTSVLSTGSRSGSILRGPLYLRGTGDPTMLADDYDALAARVAATGIETVTGGLVADDTWFDNVRLGTEWAWDDEPYSYAAQVSALSLAPDTDYDAGSVIVTVAPSTAGRAPTVTLTPPNSYVRVENRATTGAAGSAFTLSVDRRHGGNTMVVTGSMPADSGPDTNYMSVWEPALYAAAVFRAALARHGVTFGSGATRLGTAPAGAAQVAAHQSAPLGEILVPFLKLSNNNHAEVLTKAIGRKVSGAGTWSAGLAAITAWLGQHGVTTSVIRMRDGSGLSRQDLVTPAQVNALLRTVRGEAWFPTWYQALPIAGQPDRLVGGTLRRRMVGTAAAGNVHAKTGTLTSVTALSGYVTNAGGRALVFSIMLNDYLGSSPKDIEDKVAVALAESGGSDGSRAHRAPARAPLPPDDPRTAVDESQRECSWSKAC